MSEKKIDLELVEKFKNGDLASFGELVSKYTQRVHNLALRITRSEEDTEEVVQDVFVTVFNKVDKFEGKSAFSSWLYRITANAAFMKLRKRKQTPALSFEDVLEGGGEHYLVIHEGKVCAGSKQEIRDILEKALEHLPPEYRAIFVLRDIDGLSNQEVSSILGLTVPAVKSRLHRSRLLLRKKLSRFYQDYQNDDLIALGPKAQNMN